MTGVYHSATGVRKSVGGGWWRLVVGGWWCLGAVLKDCPEKTKRKRQVLKDGPATDVGNVTQGQGGWTQSQHTYFKLFTSCAVHFEVHWCNVKEKTTSHPSVMKQNQSPATIQRAVTCGINTVQGGGGVA